MMGWGGTSSAEEPSEQLQGQQLLMSVTAAAEASQKKLKELLEKQDKGIALSQDDAAILAALQETQRQLQASCNPR